MGILPHKVAKPEAENIVRYEILRSKSGNASWEIIGNLEVDNVVNSGKSFHFEDKSPLPLAYYRLKLKEVNGKITYSNIIYLERPYAFEWYLAPNPTQNQFQIYLPKSVSTQTPIYVTDILGKLVLQKTIDIGSNSSIIHTQNWPKGVYQVSIFVKEQWHTQKIVVY